MLAVVWAAEHFHLLVYGAKFAIITDHKPLIGISVITSKLQLELVVETSANAL